jgi:sigma-B regulation protein RsbU (phosphoserine phosphatase)
MMTPSDGADAALDAAAIAELLSLASRVAADEPIALVDADGRVIAGRSPGDPPGRAHPLVRDGRPAGAVVGTAAVDPALLELVARGLELVEAHAKDRTARARLSNELAIGRRIQLALVPRRFPDVPGWTFASAYEPALEVGGDLFDAFPVRGQLDRVGLLVADVTGKGIAAALLMADVRALLHAATDNAPGPADALARVNRILVTERATALMVTAVLLVVDTATGMVRYAGAGHEAPLIARCAGGVETLEAGGTILGLAGDTTFVEQEGRLDPGDALVMYTDGVTDARDRDRGFYGEDRLLPTVGGACGRPADVIVQAIMDDVRAFRGDADPFDDLTLLVVERRRDA